MLIVLKLTDCFAIAHNDVFPFPLKATIAYRCNHYLHSHAARVTPNAAAIPLCEEKHAVSAPDCLFLNDQLRPMPDKKTVKVFVASSNELKEEREKCISILNHLNKSHKHLHLEPVEWEFDMIAGNVPGYATIQKAINPKLQESNIVVFMFYSRLGHYTKEEFKLATDENKKLFAYFKKGFSPKKESFAAYGSLLDFKESLNDTVLYHEYEDLAEFEKLLYPALNLYLIESYPVATGTTADSATSASVATLIQLLSAKEEEIKQLKEAHIILPQNNNEADLEQLIKEKEELQRQLLQSKEVQEQQAKDKAALEQQLSLQIEHDALKAKALDEVEKGNYSEAEKYLKESAKTSIEETAATFYELGKIKKLQLQYKEAYNYYELAARINPKNGLYLHEAGSIANDLGLYDVAFNYCKRALEIDKEYLGEEHNNVAIGYSEIGVIYINKGDYNKAIEYLTKALNIYRKKYGEEHADIATIYNNLGGAYANKGEYDRAFQYYEQALNIDKRYYGKEHPNIATRYNNIGDTYDSKGEYDKAIQYYEQALNIDKRYYGKEHPNITARYNNLGLAYYHKGEYDKAIHYYNRSLTILQKFLPPTHPNIRKCLKNLQRAQEALNKQ